jgi:hypothetical protein
MTGKMNWRRAHLHGRPTLDYRYEHDIPDRAARWLAAVDRRERRSFGVTRARLVMSDVAETTFVTRSSQKNVTKLGRPTVRKNGVAFTAAERMRRYRARLRKARRKSHRVQCSGNSEW